MHIFQMMESTQLSMGERKRTRVRATHRDTQKLDNQSDRLWWAYQWKDRMRALLNRSSWERNYHVDQVTH